MKHARIFCVLVLSATAVAAHAAEPARLAKADVQQLISGKSVTLKFPNDEQLWFFAADGYFTSSTISSNVRGGGTWTIDDEGRVCMKFRSMAADGCRYVLKTDDGYGFTRVDGTGNIRVTGIK